MTDLQYEEIEMLAKRARAASVRLAQTSDDAAQRRPARHGASAARKRACSS